MGKIGRSTLVSLVLALLGFSVNISLFAGGKTEGPNGIINLQASSSGIIYEVDYTPPKEISINDIHYIQILIYDSLDRKVNKVYYLKTSDKIAKRNIYNLLLPDNLYEPDSELTISINYYDNQNKPLGSRNERFTYSFQLVFETIEKDGLALYRKSNRLSADFLDKGKEEYYGNVPKEIQEMLFHNNDVYILLEEVIGYNEDYDISMIKKSHGEYAAQIAGQASILQEYLTENFTYKNISNIETIVSYEPLETNARDLRPPYIYIYLISSKEDLHSLKTSSLKTSASTLFSLLSLYIDNHVKGIDDSVSSLKKELLALFETNRQTSSAYLEKNGQYSQKLAQFNAVFDENKNRLQGWIDSNNEKINNLTTDKAHYQTRIDEIQIRVNKVREGIEQDNNSDILLNSMQKELEFLQQEGIELGGFINNIDNEINAVIKGVNDKISHFNIANDHYVIEKTPQGDSGDLGSYTLVYNDADAINQDKMADIDKFNSMLQSISDIVEAEQEEIGSDLHYLYDIDESTFNNFTASGDIVDKLDEIFATLTDNFARFNKIITTQINGVTTSDAFNNIIQISTELNNPIDYQTNDQDPPPAPIDGLEKIIKINQSLHDSIFVNDNGRTVLYTTYSTIDRLPKIAELTVALDGLVGGTGTPAASTANRLPNTPGQSNPVTEPLVVTDQFNPNPDSVIDHILQVEPTLNRQDVSDIIFIYFSEALAEKVNPLVAIAQMLYHTDYLQKKEITGKSYNFGRLGINDLTRWERAVFVSRREGIRAHIQHIKAYSTREGFSFDIVDPRYTILVKENLVGTKPTFPEMLSSWYNAKESTRIKREIMGILDSLPK